MTLATQLSLTTMESLQNGLQTHFKVLMLTLLLDVTVQHQNNSIDLGVISQRCHIRVADARCKQTLSEYAQEMTDGTTEAQMLRRRRKYRIT